MKLEHKKLSDLPYNTLTVYFAPLLFDSLPLDFANYEIRLLTKAEFFGADGYLKQGIGIRQLLQNLYLITSKDSFFNNQYLIHAYLAEVVFAEDQYVVYKLNIQQFELPISVLTDMQNVLHLRTSALSRKSKHRIQKFWRDNNRLAVLYKVTDELYPTDYVKRKLSQKLGIDSSILEQMSDITEAIKYQTDSLEGVLESLNIRLTLSSQ